MVVLAIVGLCVLVATLAIPVDLLVRATLEDELDARLNVGWLFGIVERNIEPREKSGKRAGEPMSPPRREQLSLLWRKPFRDRVAQLYRRCRPAIRIGILNGRARFGLGDPADTGYAMAVLLPLFELLSQHPNVELTVAPDWSQEVLAGGVHGRVRVIPLGLVPPLIAFALSREAIGTLRAWRRTSG